MYFSVVAALALAALNGPPARAQRAPSVTINDGTIIGSESNGVESFKGIPFADPPVGNLRLKPPVPLSTPFGTIQSNNDPVSCPQFLFSIDSGVLPLNLIGQLMDTSFYQAATNAGEDCLTINVQRPAGTTAQSKLPVIYSIYGGGFVLGSTALTDGTGMITKAVSLNEPIIYVAVNYRLGGFGFLAGDDLSNEGSTNLGLRDQRLGLQWVSDNIAAFGGDPDRVTLSGESAGSISVFDQTIVNGGDNTYNGKPLFQGAIMISGSIIPAVNTTSPKAQSVYDKVVSTAECTNATDKLACLRGLDYIDFLNAVNSVQSIIGYEAINLTYFPRPDPSSNFFSLSPDIAVMQNKFAKVPILIGDQEDEGTGFAIVQTNLTTTDDLITYFASYFPIAPLATIASLVETYPDDPSAGSPFNTGPFYNLYPQYKRLAALLGDTVFTLTRRRYLELVSDSVPSWSYLASYFAGLPVLGTFHGSDALLFAGLGSPIAADSVQTYQISFVNYLDPNVISNNSFPFINWPQWDNDTRQLLHYEAYGNSLITDDFRQASFEAISANSAVLKL